MGRKRNKHKRPSDLKQLISSRFANLQQRLPSKISHFLSLPAPVALGHEEIFTELNQGRDWQPRPVPELDGIICKNLQEALELLTREIERSKGLNHLSLLNCIEEVHALLSQEGINLRKMLSRGFEDFVSVADTYKIMLESLFQTVVVNNFTVGKLIQRAGISNALPAPRERIEDNDTSDEEIKPPPKRKVSEDVDSDEDDEDLKKLISTLERQQARASKLKPRINQEWIERIKQQLNDRIYKIS